MAPISLIDQIIDLLEEQEARGVTIAELSEESRAFLAERGPRQQPSAKSSGSGEMADRYSTKAAAKPAPPAQPQPSPKPAPRPETAKATPPAGYQPPHERRAAPAPQSPAPSDEQAAPDLSRLDLDQVAACIGGCTRCVLHEERQKTVPGEGDPDARLMFIGEGPGAEEDRLGRPFVGPAGQLLDKIINAMGFQREQVYITNIVKCRPPRNRKPELDEAKSCLPFLERQVALIQPEVIVTLGATPLEYLLNIRGIRRHRGEWLEYRGIPVMPTYHPSYLLRLPDAKRDVWEDMKKVMERFGKAPPASPKRPRS